MPELEAHPEVPPHFAHVWNWFAEMPSPLSWTEIKSWSEFSGIRPTRAEGLIMLRMDEIRNG